MEKIVFDEKMEFAIKFTPFKKEDNFEDIHWLNFRAVECVANYKQDGSVNFGNFDTGNGVEDCKDFDIAYSENPLMVGFIKWDGCMEIHNLNYHFCGYSDILQRMVKCIYENAKELIGNNFNTDLANYGNTNV